jgi:hypothetical protein
VATERELNPDGSWSETIYSDDEGKPVPKEQATHAEIHEYDRDGRLILTSVGSFSPRPR